MKTSLLLIASILTSANGLHSVDNWDVCTYPHDCLDETASCCPISQDGTTLPPGQVLEVCGPSTATKVEAGTFIGWNFKCPADTSGDSTDPSLEPGEAQHNAFMEPYIWNQMLGVVQRGVLFACNFIGGFGEMLYNDNGEMMARCF